MVSALIACRTAALGGHLQRCDHCGRENPLYNSCRNRHCPKCQNLEQALWVEAQARDLPPVAYFHEVFTLPHCLNPFFLRDPDELMRCCSGRREHRDRRVPEQSRGHPGPHRHAPHLESAVDTTPTSTRSPPEEASAWTASAGSPPSRLLPAGAEAVQGFRQAARGVRARPERRAPAHARGRGRLLLRRAAAQDFVVYSKPPMAGPEQVLRYLGRYTHRIALSNRRLVAHRDGEVTFTYKDRRTPAAGRKRPCPVPSSPAASCSTSCLDASSGCATTAYWPTA